MTSLTALDDLARRAAASPPLAVDRAAYAAAGRDPLHPLLAGGRPSAPIAFFGRDPGRDEVRQMEPLVGAGGRLVRAAVCRALHGHAPDDDEGLGEASRHVFFSNTVPYKPIGNKPWPAEVIARFRPIIAAVLRDVWEGEHLITLGNVAFLWFGEAAEAHWERPDRYAASLTVDWPRRITLHPLPHPSPANAVWHKRFPAMLEARLLSLGLGTGPRAEPVAEIR